MPEHSGELPDDVEELKALTLATSARADRSEAEAEAARSDVLRLKAEVNDLAQTNAMAKAEIARLTSILKTLRRGRFGKRSEKLGADEAEQQSFAFEEVETGLEAISARLAAKTKSQARKTPGDKPRFPSHLERVEEVVEPEVPADLQDKERVRIGQDESVRLDVIRARFRLIVTIRPKYAYKEPGSILQAPAPEHIVEAGLPTEALLAQVAVSKYADGPAALSPGCHLRPRRRRTQPLTDGQLDGRRGLSLRTARRSSSFKACSKCGSASCRASPANRNSPRRSATRDPIAPSCCCSWKMGASRSTPTLSSARSGPRPSRGKFSLRRFRRRRSHMGCGRDHVANLQDERRRSLRVGQADPGADRQPLAPQRYRGAHALELQAPRLNGPKWTLTLLRTASPQDTIGLKARTICAKWDRQLLYTLDILATGLVQSLIDAREQPPRDRQWIS